MDIFRIEVVRQGNIYAVGGSIPSQRLNTIHEAVIAVQHALMLNLSHENEQRTKDKRG